MPRPPALATAGPSDSDGWCTVELHSESTEVAHDELLRLGADVRVLEPPDLRRAVARTGASIARNHADPLLS
jgi:predicted DNA-binding transcriptional regulator YafY